MTTRETVIIIYKRRWTVCVSDAPPVPRLVGVTTRGNEGTGRQEEKGKKMVLVWEGRAQGEE